MTVDAFNALVVTAGEDKTYLRQIKQRTLDDLPEGDVLIKVQYSSWKYYDALSSIGNKGGPATTPTRQVSTRLVRLPTAGWIVYW